MDTEVQPVTLGDLSHRSSVPPNACCAAEPLQQRSISTSEFLEVGGGLQLRWTEGMLSFAPRQGFQLSTAFHY